MNNSDSNKILIKLVENTETPGTPVVLAGQTSASLEITKEMREYTSKTTVDANDVPVRRYMPTRSTISISVESLYDPTGTLKQDEIFEMCYNGTKIDFVMGDSIAGSKTAKGSGFISSASGSFSMDETASASFTIDVDGGLEFETIS
ncbi:phage tail tube protein [Cyclobacterium plantarum]|uniref:Phage tail protein n=1 Tax=Cyclobacterium plantarum TaxID=2716263 RepID=A0ABX0H9B2_9BACT|nr:phage tail tube protein [Cyclobacterium plantarum]NHE57955.1 hypothetical protein [Cyclobacterium plantarum]